MSHPMNRRSFLLSSAAVGAGMLASRSLALQGSDPFGGFTFGIQSYTFRKFDLERALKLTQECGLKSAELYRGHVPTDSNADKIKGVRKMCGDYGVSPIAFGVEKFTKNHDANKKLFDFGAALGIKHFSADPDVDSFDSLDKLVAEYKISIAIHPHGPSGKGKHKWYSAEVIMKAVKDHNALIGTCLDTGHLIRMAQLDEKLDVIQQIKTMGARNFGLHLKDHDNKRKTDVVYGDPTGVLDVPGVLKTLKDLKFGGYISIEYEANADNPTPDVKKCVEYVKETVKKMG